MKQQFRRDPFSTIVLYSILLSLFFIVFAFRGMIFTMFVKPIGIVNPAASQTDNTPASAASTDTTSTEGTGQTNEAVPLQSTGTYVVKDGDTLSSVAAALNIDWKDLAAINNIQAPYSLSKGQILKLP